MEHFLYRCDRTCRTLTLETLSFIICLMSFSWMGRKLRGWSTHLWPPHVCCIITDSRLIKCQSDIWRPPAFFRGDDNFHLQASFPLRVRTHVFCPRVEPVRPSVCQTVLDSSGHINRRVYMWASLLITFITTLHPISIVPIPHLLHRNTHTHAYTQSGTADSFSLCPSLYLRIASGFEVAGQWSACLSWKSSQGGNRSVPPGY